MLRRMYSPLVCHIDCFLQSCQIFCSEYPYSQDIHSAAYLTGFRDFAGNQEY